jgi:hypothetical protein
MWLTDQDIAITSDLCIDHLDTHLHGIHELAGHVLAGWNVNSTGLIRETAVTNPLKSHLLKSGYKMGKQLTS